MAAVTSRRNSAKPKVTEINGVLWQVDEKGNPIKKVRKKNKDGSQSPTKPKKMEIGGNMWEVDDKGNPIKRLRKKGEKNVSPTSSKNKVPHPPKLEDLGGRRAGLQKMKSSRDSKSVRSKSKERGNSRARSRSRGRDGKSMFADAPTREARPGMRRRNSFGNHAPKNLDASDRSAPPAMNNEYVDEKGRKVVIDADGNKIAFDKNGKKLRPKRKPADILAGDPQLIEMKRQLEAAKEEVERLERQTQRDQHQIAQATSEMEILKREHKSAKAEKQRMDLELKNFQSRLKEQEEALANMPQLNSDGSTAKPAGGGDHLVKQITTLMDENNILLEKLAKEKAAAAEELKRKEEELRYLKSELDKLRAENDMLFRNQGAATARGEKANPMVDKLLEQKQELESKLTDRIEKLQERVDVLQKNNEVLNEDLNKATLEIHEDDDEETRKAKQMAQAVVETGAIKNPEKAKRASFMVNNGLASSSSGMDAAHSASNALRMIYRGRQNQGAEKKKTWFT